MKKNKVIALGLSATLTLTGCSSKNNDTNNDYNIASITTSTLEQETTTITESAETTTEQQTTTTTPSTIIENDIAVTSSIEESTNETTTPITEETLDEDELIQILEDQEQLIMNEAVNGTKESLKEKLDEYFTATIGFLFCNQPIKGKTLDDLTTSTKIKIISITNNINDIIEIYYPDYKITIKEKYTDVSVWTLDKFKTASSFIKDKVKDKIGEDAYNTISDTYDKTKAKIKDIGSTALDKADKLIDKGVTKIKNWWHNKTNN